MQSLTTQLEQLKLFTQESKKNAALFLRESPLMRKKREIQAHMHAKKYERAHLLHNVPVLKNLPMSTLESISYGLDEVEYGQDDFIIRQGDVGDSFYILDEGVVSVTITTTNESGTTVKEVARLQKGASFGDTALFTQEDRSASVIVISKKASCLKMMKSTFDHIMGEVKATNAGVNKTICMKTLENMPLFKTVSQDIVTKISEAFTLVVFPPSSYICRQGSLGNTFYVIISGDCVVTVTNDAGVENTVSELHMGDYFGELALLDPSNKRAANVISQNSVNAMTLSRVEFDAIMGTVRDQLHVMSKRYKLKKHFTSGELSPRIARRRRISALTEQDTKSLFLCVTLLRRSARFTMEGLWNSLYSRLYRELVLVPKKVVEYGDWAAKVMGESEGAYAPAVRVLRAHCVRVLTADASRRSLSDLSLVGGLLKQRSELLPRLEHCSLDQMMDLAKVFRIVRVDTLRKIIEVGTPNTDAFIILRGCVRVFLPAVTAPGQQSTHLIFDKDLIPGEMLCETALNGVAMSLITAVAMTDVELAVVSRADFCGIVNQGASRMHMGEKLEFLRNVDLFRKWNSSRLIHLADQARDVFVKRDTVMLHASDVSDRLFLVVSGQVHFLSNRRNRDILTSVTRFEYFGESAIIRAQAQRGAGTEPKRGSTEDVKEMFTSVCGSNVTLLVIDAQDFGCLPSATMGILIDGFWAKISWRRRFEVNLAKVKRQWRNAQKAAAAARAASTDAPSRPSSSLLRGRPELERTGEWGSMGDTARGRHVGGTLPSLQDDNSWTTSPVSRGIAGPHRDLAGRDDDREGRRATEGGPLSKSMMPPTSVVFYNEDTSTLGSNSGEFTDVPRKHTSSGSVRPAPTFISEEASLFDDSSVASSMSRTSRPTTSGGYSGGSGLRPSTASLLPHVAPLDDLSPEEANPLMLMGVCRSKRAEVKMRDAINRSRKMLSVRASIESASSARELGGGGWGAITIGSPGNEGSPHSRPHLRPRTQDSLDRSRRGFLPQVVGDDDFSTRSSSRLRAIVDPPVCLFGSGVVPSTQQVDVQDDVT